MRNYPFFPRHPRSHPTITTLNPDNIPSNPTQSFKTYPQNPATVGKYAGFCVFVFAGSLWPIRRQKNGEK
jgi:hypothetical protein